MGPFKFVSALFNSTAEVVTKSAGQLTAALDHMEAIQTIERKDQLAQALKSFNTTMSGDDFESVVTQYNDSSTKLDDALAKLKL